MTEPRRRDNQGLTAGFAFIAIAMAILVCWLKDDWSLLPPILLLEFGIYAIAVGFLIPRDTNSGSSDSAYYMIWGGLLTLLGSLWLLNSSYPVEAPIFFVAILMFVGIAIIARSAQKSAKNKNN